jgi:4'-phosphopantetheinyl transferase
MKEMRAQANGQKPRFDEIMAGALKVPKLVSGEVQLWAVRLNPCQDQIDRLAAWLSSSERKRAGRFRFGRDRRRYTVRHGFLRFLLGHHMSIPPESVRFMTGPASKPFLADDSGLYFNLSHSGELALIGLSRDAELGVDIENTKIVDDADTIVRRLFSPREVAAYFQVPASERPVAFFNCWTRKEAFVKALGSGLALSLKLFDVSVLPDETVRIVSINGDSKCARSWSLVHLEPSPGFVGALAIKRASPKVRSWIVDLDRATFQV